MRYFINLAYNGSRYHGWQLQPNAVSVQEVLNDCLSKLLRSTICVTGAGRTDTGVHAAKMIAHFDTDKAIDVEEKKRRLNAFLPKDIVIYSIFPVKNTAHARFDAISRKYIYKICQQKNPFIGQTAWSFYKKPDVDRMNAFAKILFEYDDFKCFSKSNTDVHTYCCKIMEAYWEKRAHMLYFHIKADRFLRNMVRAVVGTLLEAGLYKIDESDFRRIIESRDRGKAGFSVPPQGLFLNDISYPETILEK